MTQEQKDLFIKNYFSHHGLFNEHNGIRLVDVDDGCGVVEADLKPQAMNPRGSAHGGLIFSLIDVAIGVASRSGGRLTVTQDASVYFIRPGWKSEKLIARGRVVREGGTTGLCEAEVTTAEGVLVAKGTVSVFYLRDSAD